MRLTLIFLCKKQYLEQEKERWSEKTERRKNSKIQNNLGWKPVNGCKRLEIDAEVHRTVTINLQPELQRNNFN